MGFHIICKGQVMCGCGLCKTDAQEATDLVSKGCGATAVAIAG